MTTNEADLQAISEVFPAALDEPTKPKKRGGPPLGKFEGRPVLASRIEINNAGSGLSDALDLDPVAYHHGDQLFVLLEVQLRKVRMDELKDADGLARVHVTYAENGIVVDQATADEMMDGHREAQEEARIAAELADEAAKGIARIPGTEDA